MKKTLKEIALLINGTIKGNENIIITGVGDIDMAKDGEIAFIRDKSLIEKAKNSKASAVIVPKGLDGLDRTVVEVENPYLEFTKILNLIYLEKRTHHKGIHKTAVIGENSKVGKNVSIGAYTVVGDNVSMGDNTVLCSQVFIGDNTNIGKDGFIYPNVSIREDSKIGNNVLIHCGSVIGNDGAGFVPVGEKHVKIPHLGNVIIEDDVEIGANVCIDRGTIGSTKIGKGTKFDNLVHIAHNVQIGENSIMLAHVTVAGSAKIGKHVILSGQSGVINNRKVGDNVTAAGRTSILQDVPANTVVWGTPAKPIKEEQRILAALRHLPEMVRSFKEIKNKILKDK